MVCLKKMAERKRQKPPVAADTVLEGPQVTTKHAKLVLKPPKFITAKLKRGSDQDNFSSLLEATLQLETAEDVLQRLLDLLNSHKLATLLEQQEAWSGEEVARCIASIGKLAKMYRDNVSTCCVLVHIVELFGAKLRSSSSDSLLPKNFQLFALSLVDHGKPFFWNAKTHRTAHVHTARESTHAHTYTRRG